MDKLHIDRARKKCSRLVGRVLSQAEFYGKFPCHRVVNAAGRLAPAWEDRDLSSGLKVTFKRMAVWI